MTARQLLVGLSVVASGCMGVATGGDPSGWGGPGGAAAFDPGRVTMRRLNSIEYDNTVRDLLGLSFPADQRPSVKFQFPADEWGDGFFNDGDVLSSSPLGVEKYLAAAQHLVGLVLDPAPGNTARRALLVCDLERAGQASCLPRIVGELARRAFRRPVTDDELRPFLALIDTARMKGDSVEVGLSLALSALLVAPDFLFRIEIDPTPGQRRSLAPFELASRLSYFLWASMPDEELFARARDGSLTRPAEIARQVQRMLGDPRASAFSGAMSEQWMLTLALAFAKPEPAVYPRWQEPLRDAFAGEVKAFLAPILAGQVPADELLTARYVYANRALGMYYGLSGAADLPADRFEKVPVTDDRRGGVLRQGSFLVHTSHPDSHSPTVRGKFILDRLLCVRVPPPPGNIPAFVPAAEPEGTLRQKLIEMHHGAGGACAGCHAIIDPPGFALEHYDGAGLWRDQDNGLPVDATGALPGSGVPFDGAGELSQAIARDPRFPACLAKQVLTYATGRHLGDGDRPLIEEVGRRFSQGGLRFPHLLELVATSPAMTHRQAEPEVQP
jgi:hypothetical protein